MNIYVGNLARTVNAETLRKLFEQHGEVTTVKVMTDRFTNEPRGFGFVEMPVTDEANQAMAQLNDYLLEGQKLRVNEARPQEERSDRAPRRSFGSTDRFGGNNNRYERNGGGNRDGGSNGGWRR
jgi:RNA recognition motif-containing protein